MTEELLALRGVVANYAIILFSVFVGLLVFAPAQYEIGNAVIPGLSFGSPSLAMRMFLAAKEMLIPADVPVVALGPVASFVAPLVMAFLGALLATFPAALVLVFRFLSPGLRPEERRSLLWFSLPSLALFYTGAFFAYTIIIPETFAILYSFAEPIGVVPMFALDDFISSVFLLTLSTGLAFVLPVLMALAAKIRLIPAAFWVRHWRGAVLITVIFSAIITPDGSGVTMALLSGPLLGLYAAGTLSAAVVSAHRVV